MPGGGETTLSQRPQKAASGKPPATTPVSLTIRFLLLRFQGNAVS